MEVSTSRQAGQQRARGPTYDIQPCERERKVKHSWRVKTMRSERATRANPMARPSVLYPVHGSGIHPPLLP